MPTTVDLGLELPIDPGSRMAGPYQRPAHIIGATIALHMGIQWYFDAQTQQFTSLCNGRCIYEGDVEKKFFLAPNWLRPSYMASSLERPISQPQLPPVA